MKAKWRTVDVPDSQVGHGDVVKVEELEINDEEYDRFVSHGATGVSRTKPPVPRKRKRKTKSKITDGAKAKKECGVTPFPVGEVVGLEPGEWLQLGIPYEIAHRLVEVGFPTPTAVQSACLSHTLRLKSDVTVAAETGSGKTLAYVLPIVTRLYYMRGSEDTSNSEEKGRRLRALIITPTRELAVQVRKHASLISTRFGVYCTEIVGGLSQIKQERLLDKRPEIVVGTPGRLWSYMEETPHSHLTDLDGLKLLVVDEADRMTEQGHFRQLRNIVDFCRKNTATKFCTYAFSATLSVPKTQLVRRVGKADSKPRKGFAEVLGMSPNAKSIDLTHRFVIPESLKEYKVFCKPKDAELYLYHILSNSPGKTIVFVNTIATLNKLSALLSLLGVNTIRLHSHRQQKSRLKALDGFHSDKSAVMIATDVASRGIDVPDVNTVVHFNTPINPDLYVHRSGRTARCLKPGCSVVFVTADEFPRYERILSVLSREGDLHDYPAVHADVLANSAAVDLAKSVVTRKLELERLAGSDSWFHKNAGLADMVVDPDFCKLKMADKGDDVAKARLAIKRDSARLGAMLAGKN